MDQLVQAASDAAKQGDKNRAMELIHQALEENPNDIDALLIQSTLVDNDMHKRQILNRVLSLDATNKTAREMILEMDRAEMNSYRSGSVRASATTSSRSYAPQSPESYPAQDSYTISTGKTKVFIYSKTWLSLLCVFAALSCCATLWFASIRITHPTSLPFLIMAVILGLTALTVSSRIELNEAGIRMSALYGSTEMKWNDIASIKWDSIRRNLELRSEIGELITISAQLEGYRTIVEILRLKRPDLFSQDVFVAEKSAVRLPESQLSIQNTAASDVQPVPVQPVHLVALDPPAPKPASEKPLIFKQSSVWLVLFYTFMALSCLTGFLVASQNIASSLPFFILGGLFGLTAFSNTSNVEVKEEGIRTSSFLNSAEIKWNEISEMRSNSFRRKLKLIANNGKSVNISTQVKGYPVLIEIIRRKRPDLFVPGRAVAEGEKQSPAMIERPLSTENNSSLPVSDVSPTRTFQKSFLKQYGIFLWLTPICLLLAWFGLTVTDSQMKLATFICLVLSALVLLLPFFQVSTVKVEPNKLTIETFFQVKEFNANQIKEIKMQSREGRYGRVTNTVNILPAEGKKYPLGGFPDGEEVLYGYLINWLNTYQTKEVR